MTKNMINREKFKTELGKQLYDRLIKISDDTNFILSVLVDVQGDERKKEFIEYLDKNDINDADEILDYLDEKYYSEI